MALHYRKRSDVWHCRGSVRVGRNIFQVREFSTGCTSKTEAEAVGAAEEARIRGEFLDTGNVIEPVRVIKASIRHAPAKGSAAWSTINGVINSAKNRATRPGDAHVSERKYHGSALVAAP